MTISTLIFFIIFSLFASLQRDFSSIFIFLYLLLGHTAFLIFLLCLIYQEGVEPFYNGSIMAGIVEVCALGVCFFLILLINN